MIVISAYLLLNFIKLNCFQINFHPDQLDQKGNIDSIIWEETAKLYFLCLSWSTKEDLYRVYSGSWMTLFLASPRYFFSISEFLDFECIISSSGWGSHHDGSFELSMGLKDIQHGSYLEKRNLVWCFSWR